MFQRKTPQKKRSAIRSQPYATAIAQEAPIRGSYPIAGNGIENIEDLQTTRLQRVASRNSILSRKSIESQSSVENLTRTARSRRTSRAPVQRPNSAPHSGFPSSSTQDETPRPIPNFSFANPILVRHRNRNSTLSSLAITPIKEASPSIDIFTASRMQRPLASDTAQYSKAGTHIDLLDAASNAPANAKRKGSNVTLPDLRTLASGNKNYGEDVADRNSSINLKSLPFSGVDAFYRRENFLASRRQSPKGSLRSLRSQRGLDSDSESRRGSLRDVEELVENPPVPRLYKAGTTGGKDEIPTKRDFGSVRSARNSMRIREGLIKSEGVGGDGTGDDTPQTRLPREKGPLKTSGNLRNVTTPSPLRKLPHQKRASYTYLPAADYEPLAFQARNHDPPRKVDDSKTLNGGTSRSADSSHQQSPYVSSRTSSLISKPMRFGAVNYTTLNEKSVGRPQPIRSSYLAKPAAASTRAPRPISLEFTVPLVNFEKGIATLKKRRESPTFQPPLTTKSYVPTRAVTREPPRSRSDVESEKFHDTLPKSYQHKSSPSSNAIAARTRNHNETRRLLCSAVAPESRFSSSTYPDHRSSTVPSSVGSEFDFEEEEEMDRKSLDRPLPPVPAEENPARSQQHLPRSQQVNKGQANNLPTPPISPTDQQRMDQKRASVLPRDKGVYIRNNLVVEGSDHPVSLDGVVDLSNTEDTEVITRTLPGMYSQLEHNTIQFVTELANSSPH